MTTYEWYVVPEHREQKATKHTCDICGKEAPDPQYGDWTEKLSDYTDEVTIKHYYGYAAYEDDFRRTDYFDICPDCFVNILTPFLESKGAKKYR